MTNNQTKLIGADKTWGFRIGCEGMVSIREAMRHLGVGRTKVWQLQKEGKIRWGNIGRKVVICRRSMNEFLKTVEV
jgi:hypothetical protein